jgi:hypothetical protein
MDDDKSVSASAHLQKQANSQLLKGLQNSAAEFVYGGANQQEIADAEAELEYTLRDTMLPRSYFPTVLAQKILFIGKAVKVLQSKLTPLEDRIP